jgi:hypothetical protein
MLASIFALQRSEFNAPPANNSNATQKQATLEKAPANEAQLSKAQPQEFQGALLKNPPEPVATFPLRLKSKFAPPAPQPSTTTAAAQPPLDDWIDAKDYCQVESYESLKARVEKRERVI